MAKTMLIDATHPEETRVAVVDGRKLEEFDVEVASRRPLKGNIYLAKVTRVEPSLQAAFVEYGGNRHGFLAFSEIHPDYYRIPVADREALLRAVAEDLEDDESDDSGHPDQASHQGDHLPDQEGHDQEHYLESDDHQHDDHEHDGHEDDRGYHDHAAAASPTEMIVSESGEFVAAPADAAGTAAHAEPVSPPSSFESIGLAARQDVLRGDTVIADSAEVMPSQTFPEGGEGDDVPPSPQAEIVEVSAPEAMPETVGGEEAPIQDDPEADEERARRRRQRNLRRYKIQEVIKRRQILLVQVTKEERGNKGAALTTYLSLAGRYCVLMPNTDRGGGISRRITSATDRKRLKSIIDDLDAPEGMAVIVRTAGSERSKAEVKRDFEYLLRLWDEIRDVTLRSTAPALIYEEASLIKRSIRDLYTRDIGDIVVAGGEAYIAAKSFMRTLTPSHAKRVQLYRDNSIPLFQRYQIESQLAAIHQPVVQLKSGGYIVINQTEALVAVDVNSGRSTKERNIEETALRTNLEAADEVARQLRLRDLAGLIVIDFIDMEENRNNAAVERRMKEALKNDRARIQIGRISTFGLLEMSRQRLHPSLAEASTEICPHCAGTGRIRSVDSTALHVLRMVEEEITRSYSPGVAVMVPGAVALYILNQKRASLSELEQRRGVRIYLEADDSLIPPDYRLERLKQLAPGEEVQQRQLPPVTVVEEDYDVEEDIEVDEDETGETEAEESDEAAAAADGAGQGGEGRGRRRRRRRRSGRGERFRADEFTESSTGENGEQPAAAAIGEGAADEDEDLHEDADREDGGRDEGGDEDEIEANADAADGDQPRRRRRRGRRGGRRRSRRPQDGATAEGEAAGEDEDGAGSDHNVGQAEPTPSAAMIAGSGEQPSLPDVLPTHWRQQTPAAGYAPQSAATEALHADTAGESHAAPALPADQTAAAQDAAALPENDGAVSEAAPADQGNGRRRKREDGERAPRSRKPRRSREETPVTAEETTGAEAEEPAIEPKPAVAPQPTVSEPQPFAAQPMASVPQAGPDRHEASSPSEDARLDVTVIGEGSQSEDAPKRRGWWRRLME
ncbi:MAG TPA: Rne/Rng family ribonuclease [Terriglobia bacterium]|nr:Rne/Rng family ribonuclease [Terriglobia bacterium]